MKRAFLSQNLSGCKVTGTSPLKIKLFGFAMAIFASTTASNAQQSIVNVRATNNDISCNLDLQAVASLFGQASNLEVFEQRLNDNENGISNLDLNRDGQIDYLRVVESREDNQQQIVIQAIIDRTISQDVATIQVDSRSSQRTVHIVGDPYIYGTNYVIEPVYPSFTPPIISAFTSYNYRCWVSPYYYGYYPTYFHRRSPIEFNNYNVYIHKYIDLRNKYYYNPYYSHYTSRGSGSGSIYRNDYASLYPEYSFANRHTTIKNRYYFDDYHHDNNLYERHSYDSRQPYSTSRITTTYSDRSPYSCNRSGYYESSFSGAASGNYRTANEYSSYSTSAMQGRYSSSSSTERLYNDRSNAEYHSSYNRRINASDTQRQAPTTNSSITKRR